MRSRGLVSGAEFASGLFTNRWRFHTESDHLGVSPQRGVQGPLAESFSATFGDNEKHLNVNKGMDSGGFVTMNCILMGVEVDYPDIGIWVVTENISTSVPLFPCGLYP